MTAAHQLLILSNFCFKKCFYIDYLKYFKITGARRKRNSSHFCPQATFPKEILPLFIKGCRPLFQPINLYQFYSQFFKLPSFFLQKKTQQVVYVQSSNIEPGSGYIFSLFYIKVFVLSILFRCDVMNLYQAFKEIILSYKL